VEFRIASWRLPALLALLALLLGITAAAPASAATSTGWIRLANLSQNTSAVDVYVYPSGSTAATVVVRDLAYGGVSGYQVVNAGGYSVVMRSAGSSASSKAVLSTSATVKAGQAYTLASLSVSSSSGHLMVLDDSLTTPQGKSLVRVIQATLNPKVTFHCSCAPGAPGNIATDAAPGSVSMYAPIPPGTWTMTATATAPKPTTASLPITLTANTVRTEVVLQGPSGVEILNLVDAVGAGEPAVGGVGTGFGGTAPRGPGSPLPWLAVIGAGALAILTGGLRLRRTRMRRVTAGT
jgi:Domain of unknown function (DUF4397)